MRTYLFYICYLLLVLEAIIYSFSFPKDFSQFLLTFLHFLVGQPFNERILMHGCIWLIAFIGGIGLIMQRSTNRNNQPSHVILETLHVDSSIPQTIENERQEPESTLTVDPNSLSPTLVLIELINRTTC